MNSLWLYDSVWWSFLLSQCLLNLKVDISKKLSALLWYRTVRLYLFSLRSEFFHMQQTDLYVRPHFWLWSAEYELKAMLYLLELEVKETTETAAPFLELYLIFYIRGHLSTRICDKRHDFNYEIINILQFSRNPPAYWV